MRNMYGIKRKSLSIAVTTALLLYFGAVPQEISWDEGISSSGLVMAAGRNGGGNGGGQGGGRGRGHGGGHDGGGDHGNGHSIVNIKGKDPKSGSDTGSGSTKGRGAGSQAVVEKIFENG